MSCLNCGLSAIGTTKGFDELYSINPSVVNENRLYALLNPEIQPEALKNLEFNLQCKNKYTFRYRKSKVKNSVHLFLSTDWSQKYALTSQESDFFSLELDLSTSSQRVFYKFLVDSNDWCLDPESPVDYDSNGILNNVIDFTERFTSLIPLRKYFITHIRNKIDANSEIYMNLDESKNTLSLFIYNSRTFEGVAVINRSAYGGDLRPIQTSVSLPGEFADFLFFSYLRTAEQSGNLSDSAIISNKNMKVDFRISTCKEDFKSKVNIEGINVLHIKYLPHNSTIACSFKLFSEQVIALKFIEEKLNVNLEELSAELAGDLKMNELNYLLYSCDVEEHTRTNNFRGTYCIPNHVKLPYAGFSSVFFIVNQAKLTNKLDHPIYENIRDGDWLLNYLIERLKDFDEFKRIKSYLDDIFDEYKNLPKFLKPEYFNSICLTLEAVIDIQIKKLFKLNHEIIDKPMFKLIKSSIQFVGDLSDSKLISVSAGLPHFSSGYMRSWGRDTFISFYGLFLSTKQYNLGKKVILDYAATLRHGLIPNLFDNGHNPRYNARDAVWFFVKAVMDYIVVTKDEEILEEKVKLNFLSDNQEEHLNLIKLDSPKVSLLQDVIVEIYTKHAEGIHFREWNAGNQIDENMVNTGFNVQIYMNRNNGFVYGGNSDNCGTWMDKMGSVNYVNKGRPATSRHGANVELNAIIYATLVFFCKHFENSTNTEVQESAVLKLNSSSMKLKMSNWAQLIKHNFEKEFIVTKKLGNSTKEYIYLKDLLSDDRLQENKMRPNYIIALAVAPDLVSQDVAVRAIESFEEMLLVSNGIGVKTLNSEDKEYNGDYNNNDHSHGFNYHNGPEWVWPIGFYFMALRNYMPKSKVLALVSKALKNHLNYIQENEWEGLPELTNSNGTFCSGSCNTQAWSISTILEAISKIKEDL